MNPGTRVVFHRPGSTRTEIVWSGLVEGIENETYLIRDDDGRLRVVPVSARWLMEEKEYGQRSSQRKTETTNS